MPTSSIKKYRDIVASHAGVEAAAKMTPEQLIQYTDTFDLWPKTYLNEMTPPALKDLADKGWITKEQYDKLTAIDPATGGWKERGSVHEQGAIRLGGKPINEAAITRAKALTSSNTRQEIQKSAKNLGLPATGSNDEISTLVNIANKPPSDWTLDEFKKIGPHLSFHRIVERPGVIAAEAIPNIKKEGLKQGNVDSMRQLMNGGWTWNKGLSGNVAIFIEGGLKYENKTSPNVIKSGRPLTIVRVQNPVEPGDVEGIYHAITGK